jgi:membrane protease YdiL (CAAX protease family)
MSQPQPQPQKTQSDRVAGAIMLSSIIAGLILGIGARLVMRIVALIAHIPLTFTFDGTFGLVMIGFFLGFVAGFVYLICVIILFNFAKVRKHFPGPIWRGLAFGVLLLVLTQLIIYFNSQSLVGDINLGIPLLNKVLFAALALVYGLALGLGEKFFDRILPRAPEPAATDTPTS